MSDTNFLQIEPSIVSLFTVVAASLSISMLICSSLTVLVSTLYTFFPFCLNHMTGSFSTASPPPLPRPPIYGASPTFSFLPKSTIQMINLQYMNFLLTELLGSERASRHLSKSTLKSSSSLGLDNQSMITSY